ncbi:MAG: glycosyltransferase [Bryobacteraceae bacterium]|jgi:GT2 family glycosyltransferase/glycosyltransferase involved in cell wall biosynthesis
MAAASIIIPVYNALEYARQCLESVYRAATRVQFEVIVVNNGSAPEVAQWLSSEMERRARLSVLSFDRPLGFARAVNEGARKARHDFLVLLNSDAIVTDGWLDGLLEAMHTDPRIGVASPVTNHSSPGRQLVSGPLEAGTPHRLMEEPQRLFFFCVMIRRELWDSLGGLDEIFQLGTYEDDDFCLRARLAGWSLVVNPCVFVFHHESKTFQKNQIDKDEWLFSNESVFLERVGSLSRSLSLATHAKTAASSTSVIVAVAASAAGECAAERLIDSLTSLRNQTVTGFETVIVSRQEQELPTLPAELVRDLRIRRVTIPGDLAASPGSLWNAGIGAAQGDFLAYLPAGDVYFPYHLEILRQSLEANKCSAVYTSWSVAIHSSTKTRRAAVTEFEAKPEHLSVGAWAPLVCWMHHRSCLPGNGFRADLQSFAEWDFTLRLSQATNVWFEPALTCERNRWPGDRSERAEDAESIMNAFPAPGQGATKDRLDFLKAVKDGVWEESLIARRHEIEYRARRLFRQKLVSPALPTALVEVAPTPGRIDFIFLNILRWNDLTQRPHHFASGLGKRGYRVFWVDVNLIPAKRFAGNTVPRKLADNLFEIQLPGFDGDIYHFSWYPAILDLMIGALDQLRKASGIGAAVQLVNFPAWTPLAKRARQHFGWPIVYDCLDDQYAFSELYEHGGAAYEAELTETCDVLVTSGRQLYEAKAIRRKDAVLILNAAHYGIFKAADSRGLLDHLPRPVIGFFGSFADWLDLDWVAAAARRFPSWSFVYIGSQGFAREETKERWRAATSAPNVHVFPQTDLATLAAYLAQFDVCTMPFQDLPITRSMHAVKIYEYLAAGKHILVPALPEMREFEEPGLLVTYGDREQSFALLEALASQPPTSEQILARTSFAARNDWSARLDQLIEALARCGIIAATL